MTEPAFECRRSKSRAKVSPELYSLSPLCYLPPHQMHRGREFPGASGSARNTWLCPTDLNAGFDSLKKKGRVEECHVLEENAQGTGSPKGHSWRVLGGHLPHPSFSREENGGPSGEVRSLHTELRTTLQTARCAQKLAPRHWLGEGTPTQPRLFPAIWLPPWRVSPSPGLRVGALQRSHR